MCFLSRFMCFTACANPPQGRKRWGGTGFCSYTRLRALAQGKSPRRVANSRFLSSGEPDFEDIEADGHLAPEELEPAASATALFLAFEAVNGAGRRTRIGGGSRFHLAKDECIPLAAHEINLPSITPAKIMAQHAHTMRAHPRCRHQLTVLAHISRIGSGIRIPAAAPSVQQVQTSGDDVA